MKIYSVNRDTWKFADNKFADYNFHIRKLTLIVFKPYVVPSPNDWLALGDQLS